MNFNAVILRREEELRHTGSLFVKTNPVQQTSENKYVKVNM